MTATATWFRSAAIVSAEEAAAFFADRTRGFKISRQPGRPARAGPASLGGHLIKR